MLDTIQDGRAWARISTVAKPMGFDEAIAESIALWREVCALPRSVLNSFGYVPNDKRSGVGFEVKLEGDHWDRKIDMHLTLDAQEQQLAQADATDVSGTFRRFILSVERFVNAIEPAVAAYAERIGRDNSLPDFAERIVAAKRSWMPRFLWYPPGSVASGEILAASHTDKGGFAPHAFEDGGFMEYMVTKSPEVWRRMEGCEDGIPFLPGVSLQEHTGCRVTAAMHRVKADDISVERGRVAAVCFVDSAGMRYFNKRRFGAQQTMPFAYNYDYGPHNHEEFSRFFID